MKIRNVSRNQFSDATGSLDVEFLFNGEWLPFTTSPSDTSPTNAAILLEIQRRSEIGDLEISDYTPQDVPTEEERLAAWRARAVCSRFQAKAALEDAGLLTDANAAVAAADVRTQLAWAEAVEFRRMSPTIQAMAAALSLSDAEVDALFHAAMAITA